jgi:predicted nucleotide-binding protein
MAKSKTKPPTPGPPQVTPQQGIQLIKSQIEKAEALLGADPISSNDFETWQLVAKNILEKTFGVNSPNVSSIMDAARWWILSGNEDHDWWQKHYTSSLQTQITMLGGLVELLQTEVQLSQGQVTVTSPTVTGHRIFLVHGHSEEVLHMTARFLEKLNQEVIILREQPNQGRTIIEKFEDHADVGFAIVLLTADDRGGPINKTFEELTPRARQNVIFELGYFIGKLGRKRVCALYTPEVEIPSDYSGVLYVQFDEHGAWRLALAKEMKAAGFIVDMNLAL